jgi:protease PrsW
MTNGICCVCDKAATQWIGERPFCDEHFINATRQNGAFIRTGFINLGIIVVFTVVVALLAPLLPTAFVNSNLVLIGLVLALIPAALWINFFYQQDQLEPEPKSYVLGVFLLALLATDVVWRRVVVDFFHLSDWVARNDASALIGNTLVVGILLQLIVYAVVRYMVYSTPEFDERMDGIVYGTAAGLGVATMLNINFILDSGGANLGPGVIHVVVTALAQAAFGGVIGYFMGEMKFTDEAVWWMPLGLLIAAALDGLFEYLLVEVSSTGLQVSPWRGLIFALLVAVATFGVLIFLIRRAINETLKQQAARPVSPASTGD